MSKQELLALEARDFVYRISDGWGGVISQSVHETLGYNKKLAWPKSPGKYSVWLKTSPSYISDTELREKYPQSFKFTDHEQWAKFDPLACDNPMAWIRYLNLFSNAIADDLSSLVNDLRNRPML